LDVNVLDLGDYIVDYVPKISGPRLQKICYYTDAWHMVWEGESPVEVDWEAWINGPGSYHLYLHYQGDYLLDGVRCGSCEEVPEKVRSVAEKVYDTYGDFSPQQLSSLVRQELPWKETRRGAQGFRSGPVISKDLVKRYYGSL
jgi:uncharacterized phage-associated protein